MENCNNVAIKNYNEMNPSLYMYLLPSQISLLSLLFLAIPAHAQSDESTPPEEIVLDAVEVSAKREKSTVPLIEPASTLSGTELTSRAAATLGETLGDELGVANSTFGPNVGLPLIRGQHGPRVRVLIGGVGTHDAAVVSPDHGVTIEPLLAERIRVVKGPSVVRHGGGSIGGAVEVEDRRIPDSLPKQIEGVLQTRYNANSINGPGRLNSLVPVV